MPVLNRDLIEPLPGFRSQEASLFVAQWNDLSQCMREDTRGLDPAELEWQPAPGQNTIGMLIAHIAIVEVFWTHLGPLGQPEFHCEDVLGIGIDDDGMPIPEGGAPPATLRGKDLAWYDALLAKAREFSSAAARKLEDQDFSTVRRRTRVNGEQQEFNTRWVLYHMLEHFAGHYGQVNLLRHHYRASVARR